MTKFMRLRAAILTFLSMSFYTGCATMPAPGTAEKKSPGDGVFFREPSVGVLENHLQKSARDGDMFTLATLYEKTGRPEKAFRLYVKTIDAAQQSSELYWEGIGAAIGLVNIRRRVRSFESNLMPKLMEWSKQPGKLAPEALYQLRTLAFSFATKKGEVKASEALLRATGCITKWALTEPIGSDASGKKTQNRLLHHRVWPQMADAGEGRPPTPITDTTFKVCQITPQTFSSLASGTVMAKSALHLEKAMRIWLRLQSTFETRIHINEKRIYAQESQSRWLPETRWLSIWLPAGSHMVTVSAYSPEFTPAFSLSAITEAQHRVSADAASLPTSAQFAPREAQRLRLPEAQTDSAVLAQAIYFSWNVDPYKLEPLKKILKNEFPLHLLLQADYELSTPFTATETGMENARKLYKKAIDAFPALVDAAVYLAKNAQRKGRTEQAFGILTDAIAAMPDEPLLHLTLAQIAYEKEWIQASQDALGKAASIVGENCEIKQWRYAIALHRKDFQSTLELARKISACAASSSALATELTRKGDFFGAINAQKRIAALQPNSVIAQMDVALAMMRAGRNAAGIEKLKETMMRFPHAAEPPLHLIDAYMASEKSDEALALCSRQRSLPMRPELYRVCELALGQSAMSAYRVDGLKVVKQFIEDKTPVHSDFAWVLDRMVHKVDDYGSGVQLVHWIGYINSQDAVDEYGELHIPPGAMVLQARVIKPSLDVAYPTAVEHKSSLSLPNLEVGDFVEFETVSHMPLHGVFKGEFDTAPFYFRDFNSTFVRSELIVLAPRQFALQFDTRGDVPEPVIHMNDNIQVVTFRVRNQTPLRSEPGTPDAKEFLPSIRVTANGTRQAVCDWMNEQMYTSSQIIPALDHLLRKNSFNSRDKNNHQKAAAIFRWINDNIEDDSMLFEPVSYIFSRKRGSRVRLFQQMLAQLNIDTQLGLAMTAFDDHAPSEVTDIDRYTVPVVKLQDGTWVSFQDKYATMGTLPSELRFQPVLMLENCTLEKTTAGAAGRELSTVNASLSVDDNGNATGTVTQTVAGDTSAILRSLFENSKSKQRRIVEEHLLAALFPEAVLLKFSIENLNARHLPLIITFDVSISQFAPGTNKSRRMFLPMPIRFTQYTNGIANRALPLVLATYFNEKRTIKVKLPKGSRIVKLPDNRCEQSETTTASYCTNFSGSQNQMQIDLNAMVDIERVPAKNYTEFQEFTQTTEQMNSISIDIR